MSLMFLLGNIPYFRCLVRREYTRNMADRHGEYLAAVAIAAWCRRGRMLGFQVVFTGEDDQGNYVPTGGAMFAQLPIEALCWRPCPRPAVEDIAPWDVFSETFAVVELEFISRGKVTLLPNGHKGRYLFTVDFCRSDLADDPEQHKQLHVARMDGGWFAAMPNNRMLVHDPAFFRTTDQRPDFVALAKEFSAE